MLNVFSLGSNVVHLNMVFWEVVGIPSMSRITILSFLLFLPYRAPVLEFVKHLVLGYYCLLVYSLYH